MIYLIDDKIKRQEGFGWTVRELEENKNFIKAFHTYSQFSDLTVRTEIFKDGNVILFHESFFDAEKNKQNKDVNDIRTQLLNFANENPNSIYVTFSGSNDTREFEGNSASVPVSILYKNLSDFLLFFQESGNYDLNKLLYGRNSEIEKEVAESFLLHKNSFSDSTSKIAIDEDILFIRSRHDIENPFSLTTESKILFNKDANDNKMHEKTLEWLSARKYDMILLPISFGHTLSDFNGLRLASHIRCTQTLNQLTPLFIYSFVNVENLLQSKYVNILKTKNVFLIDYSVVGFEKIKNANFREFDVSEILDEIGKLQLEVPKDIGDNHSVANEWGIFQMARNSGINISEIEGFDFEKLNRIYFKWLITKNNLHKPISMEQKTEQAKYAEKLQGLKVLGKIDLTKFQKK